MMDDQLNMQIKGVDNGNLLQHTDFFIWSADLAPTQIDKVTSSLDVLPTVANLFAWIPAEPSWPATTVWGTGRVCLLLRRQLV